MNMSVIENYVTSWIIMYSQHQPIKIQLINDRPVVLSKSIVGIFAVN